MFLGVKAVIAFAIERIHSANLVNFGIIPLLFENQADYDLIEQEDTITIENAASQLAPGKTMKAVILKKNGTKHEIILDNRLSDEDVKIIIAGGRLNYKG